jgi:hypothetical protein
LAANELTSITKDESKPLQQIPKDNPPPDFANILSASLKAEAKQLLIALLKFGRSYNEHSRIDYGFEMAGTQTNGFTTFGSLKRQLAQLGLADFDAKDDTVRLSNIGRQFVEWLEKNGEIASFFESPQLGSWGSPSERYLQFKDEMQRRQR